MDPKRRGTPFHGVGWAKGKVPRSVSQEEAGTRVRTSGQEPSLHFPQEGMSEVKIGWHK